MMLGTFTFDIFNLEVAVFDNDAERDAVLTANGCDPDEWDAGAIAYAHLDTTRSGEPCLTMVIKPHATDATIAHECVHLADFAMQRLGIPTMWENTEVRAYLVGHAFSEIVSMRDIDHDPEPMTDTCWVVRVEALSFKTKREADAFRNKMEDAVTDAVTAMPEAADLTLVSSLLER